METVLYLLGAMAFVAAVVWFVGVVSDANQNEKRRAAIAFLRQRFGSRPAIHRCEVEDTGLVFIEYTNPITSVVMRAWFGPNIGSPLALQREEPVT